MRDAAVGGEAGAGGFATEKGRGRYSCSNLEPDVVGKGLGLVCLTAASTTQRPVRSAGFAPPAEPLAAFLVDDQNCTRDLSTQNPAASQLRTPRASVQRNLSSKSAQNKKLYPNLIHPSFL